MNASDQHPSVVMDKVMHALDYDAEFRYAVEVAVNTVAADWRGATGVPMDNCRRDSVAMGAAMALHLHSRELSQPRTPAKEGNR